MAGKQIALTVSLDVTQPVLNDIADYVVDYLYSNYGNTVCDCAGVVKKEMIADVIACEQFTAEVVKLARKYGEQFLYEPWDYMDYEFIFTLPGGRRLIQCLEEMERIVEEADRDSIDESVISKAIETLSKVGYTVSKK